MQVRSQHFLAFEILFGYVTMCKASILHGWENWEIKGTVAPV
jgi:hypothetical protein